MGAAARHRMIQPGEHLERGVDRAALGPRPGSHHGVAPGHPLVGDPRQVDRHPLARCGHGLRGAVGLQRADAGGYPGGSDDHVVVDDERPARQGPGHHGAGALDGERAVDPQAGAAIVAGRGGDVVGHQSVERQSQLGPGRCRPGRRPRPARRTPAGCRATARSPPDGPGGAGRRRPGPPWSGPPPRGPPPAGRGCAGAPRSGASTPRWRPPRTGRPAPPPRRRACSSGSGHGRGRPRTTTNARWAASWRRSPRSMVRPRCFSSVRRSGSTPVSARTSVDFPWSTCPAVATTSLSGTASGGAGFADPGVVGGAAPAGACAAVHGGREVRDAGGRRRWGRRCGGRGGCGRRARGR